MPNVAYQHDLLVYLNRQSLQKLETECGGLQWVRPINRRQVLSGAKDGRSSQIQSSLEALDIKPLNKQVSCKSSKRGQRVIVLSCNDRYNWCLNPQTAPASGLPDRRRFCV